MLGGNAGARLAEAQGIPVSSDTLLQLVRATDVPERSTRRASLVWTILRFGKE